MQEEEEQGEEEEAAGNWFKALVSAANDDASIWWYCLESARSGVVNVGELDADVVTDEVVMPINVVVTTVSISGDESAVRVVYVGVCVGTVDGVEIAPPPAPVIESFFSNLLDASPGAELPPRQGKQHRNSVEQEIIAQFHDYLMTS